MPYNNRAFEGLDPLSSHQEFGSDLGCLLLDHLLGLLNCLFHLLDSFHLGFDSLKVPLKLLLHLIKPDETLIKDSNVMN